MECCHFWVSGNFVCATEVSSHFSNHLEPHCHVFAQSYIVVCLSAQRERLLKMVSPLNTKSFILNPAKPAIMMTLEEIFISTNLFSLLCVLVMHHFRSSMFLSASSVHNNVLVFLPLGTFKLTIEFTEEYPNKPPTVRFISKMFHPNGKSGWLEI